MDTKYFFYVTLVISVVVQVITGFIEIGALFINVPTIYSIIRQLLLLELGVQFIEGVFYVWLVYNFSKIVNVTPKRYIDWAITTPTMLITLIIYLIYLGKKEKNKIESESLFYLISDNKGVIIPVIILNWLMLVFGYLGEMKILPLLLGVFLGFIPFLIYYYLIYINYVHESKSIKNNLLFWYFFFFWSLYGVVAVLPYYVKNSLYNILDLFAKNFFGLFLSYIIFSGNY
jgi:bacteriorhodopsin